MPRVRASLDGAKSYELRKQFQSFQNALKQREYAARGLSYKPQVLKEYGEGDVVEANTSDAGWMAAEITKLNTDGTYNILLVDGREGDEFPLESVRDIKLVHLWDKTDVRQWLMELEHLVKYAEKFFADNVTGNNLLAMTSTDLRKMRVAPKDVKRFMELFHYFKLQYNKYGPNTEQASNIQDDQGPEPTGSAPETPAIPPGEISVAESCEVLFKNERQAEGDDFVSDEAGAVDEQESMVTDYSMRKDDLRHSERKNSAMLGPIREEPPSGVTRRTKRSQSDACDVQEFAANLKSWIGPVADGLPDDLQQNDDMDAVPFPESPRSPSRECLDPDTIGGAVNVLVPVIDHKDEIWPNTFEEAEKTSLERKRQITCSGIPPFLLKNANFIRHLDDKVFRTVEGYTRESTEVTEKAINVTFDGPLADIDIDSISIELNLAITTVLGEDIGVNITVARGMGKAEGQKLVLESVSKPPSTHHHLASNRQNRADGLSPLPITPHFLEETTSRSMTSTMLLVLFFSSVLLGLMHLRTRWYVKPLAVSHDMQIMVCGIIQAVLMGGLVAYCMYIPWSKFPASGEQSFDGGPSCVIYILMAILCIELLPTDIIVGSAGWGKWYVAIFGAVDRLYLFLVLPVVFGYCSESGAEGQTQGPMGFSSLFAAAVVWLYVFGAACIELVIATSGKGRSYAVIHSVVFVLLWGFLIFFGPNPPGVTKRTADTAHMVFITWLAGSYGYLPVATFLRLVTPNTSEAEMVLVYIAWLAFLAVIKEMWKTSISWATDPEAGFKGDFFWLPIYWLESLFDAFFLLQWRASGGWYIVAFGIVFKTFVRDSGIYSTLMNYPDPGLTGEERSSAELRVLLRDLPPKLRRFSKAAFADMGTKIMVACMLATDLILDSANFGNSMVSSTVYLQDGTSTENQLANFVLLMNIQVITIKISESYLKRSHRRLVPLLRAAKDENRLGETEWKEDYFRLLNRDHRQDPNDESSEPHWSIHLSAPEYWKDFTLYTVAVCSSFTHNILLTYLHGAT